jgi:hypothetical protein
MIKVGGSDEGASLVAARRTTSLGRYNLPLKTMSRNDVGFCRGTSFLLGVVSVAVEVSLEVENSCSWSFVCWVSPPGEELHQ